MLKPRKVRGPTTAALVFNPQCIPSTPSIKCPPLLEESYSYQSSDYTTAAVAIDPQYPSPPSISSPLPLMESYSSQSSDYSSYSGFSPPPMPEDVPPTLIPQRTTFVRHHPELLFHPRLLIPSFDSAQSQRAFIYPSPSQYGAPSDYSAWSTSPSSWIPDYHSPPAAVPLAHPMPRTISQPRPPLLDYPGDKDEETDSAYTYVYVPIPRPPAPEYIQQQYAHAPQATEYSPRMYMAAHVFLPPPTLLSPLELSEYTQLRTCEVASNAHVYNYYPDYDAPPESYPFSTHQVPPAPYTN
ncbi:hypothetical protein C8R45DRAFT_1105406 [Mycena sanguinolenta]|nr:hypothetical protein C8R45DRAFT_1105406 [Mycena sanguinolenta]